MPEKEPGYFEQTEAMLRQYLNDRLLLFKLKASEQSARVSAQVVVIIILVLLGFFALFFVSIMAGYLFAEWTGSLFYGFSIVTGIYILLLIIVLAVRKKYLVPYLTDTVIRIIFDQNPQDDDDEPETGQHS